MKFVITLFDGSGTTSYQNWEKDIEKALQPVRDYLNTGQLSGVLFRQDGTSLGSWGFSATSTSSYAVVP